MARDLPPWHTKNIFTFHSRSRVRVKQCASNLYQNCLTSRSIDLKKKNHLKSIIRTGVTVPNVQKYVMVATLTLNLKGVDNLKILVKFINNNRKKKKNGIIR